MPGQAPWLAKTMYANLAAFAAVVLVIAIWTTDRAVLIPAIIASGIFIGGNNTITTQAVMTVSPVERPVASAAYSFVRFIGGGLAPYVAGRLVLAAGIHVPFFIAVVGHRAGIGILATAHSVLGEAERVQAQQVTAPVEEPAAGALIPVPADITMPRGRPLCRLPRQACPSPGQLATVGDVDEKAAGPERGSRDRPAGPGLACTVCQ